MMIKMDKGIKTGKRGFTLVEILVVVSIIAILMGLLLVAYQGTRASARDGKRKADLEQIRMALQMYHTDCGNYPSEGGTYGLPFGSALTSTCLASSVTYMSTLPTDPNLSNSYRYRRVNEHSYCLCAKLETGGSSPCATACSGNCGGDCGTEACDYFTCQP
jgi:general secretion pathway protein G